MEFIRRHHERIFFVLSLALIVCGLLVLLVSVQKSHDGYMMTPGAILTVGGVFLLFWHSGEGQ